MTITKRLIRAKEIKHRTGLSIATVYRMIARGSFPKPVKIGSGQFAPSAWVQDEIDAWIDALAEARNDAEKTDVASRLGDRS